MVRLSKTAAAVLGNLYDGPVSLKGLPMTARRRRLQRTLGTLWLHGLVRHSRRGFVLTLAGRTAFLRRQYTPEPLGAARPRRCSRSP
jgi:hypothetical protein